MHHPLDTRKENKYICYCSAGLISCVQKVKSRRVNAVLCCKGKVLLDKRFYALKLKVVVF